MKTDLNFLELHYLVNELQVLVGSRVDKIYDGLLFVVHKSGQGKLFLRITDKVLWLAESKPLAPEKVSGLCSVLRKRLEGKKVASIEQIGSERIVKFTFETQKETYFLYVELFSNGNVILTDSANTILAASEERAWKDRTIKRGVVYQLPPPKDNLFELSEIPDDEASISRLGFGKLLAKEIVARGGGMSAYKSLLSEKPSARAYGPELSPIRLVQFEESGESFPSFSALIDSRLSSSVDDVRKSRVRKSFEAKRAKLEEVISVQSRNVESLEASSIDSQRKGELIYEHYQELKEILDELNKAKSKFSLQDIKKKLQGHPKIKDLNPKTGDVFISLD